MMRGKRSFHAKERHEPWGRYVLKGWKGMWLQWIHACPSLPVFRRPLLWLRKPLKECLSSDPVDAKIWGLRLRLWPSGNLSEQRLLFMPQFLDVAEREFMAREFRAGSQCFLDVGANAGVYTLWAASLGLGVQIEAFEPDPELCERLQSNLARNGIEKARLHSVALGNPQKPSALFRNERNRGENRLVDARHRKGIPVSVRPLWEILQERNIGRVDVLKIDVEGNEAEILLPFFSQSPKSLWPKSVICELPRKGRDWRNCRVASLLAERQYTLLRRTRMNGIFQRPAGKEDG